MTPHRTILAALALSACGTPATTPDRADAAAPPDVVDAANADLPDDRAPPPADVPDVPDASTLPDAFTVAGRAVVAWVVARDTEAWWVEERLAAIPWRAGDREVGPRRLVHATGATEPRVAFEPTSDERLLAVAAHPSGAWTAAVATADLGVALVRVGPGAAPPARVTLDDPALAADRDAWRGDAPPARLALSPRSEDSVRLAADGEDVVVTLTTAWDSALAYRWRWSAGQWARGPRTLLAPTAPLPVFIPDTASYDVFDAVVNPWATHVCVDMAGVAHVALWVDTTRLRALNRAFGTGYALRTEGPPAVERPSDVLVLPVGRDGRRGEGRVVGVANVDDEAYAVACGRDRVAVVGRHRREVGRDNTELHAMLAVIGGGDVAVRSFDGDANAIAQAVAFDDGGGVWVGGTEGWTQNPVGVSVAGPGRPFLLRWSGHADEAPARLAAPAVRGHGELRAVAATPRSLLVGGVEDGPVTHTWDGDRAALRGDGWARLLPRPP